ncbi:MAG: coiled-coil domain-containing protein [Candidatus Methanofastidiosia archaeon]
MNESPEISEKWERICRKYEEDNYLLEKQLAEMRIERDEYRDRYEGEKRKSLGWLVVILFLFLVLTSFGIAYLYLKVDDLSRANKVFQIDYKNLKNDNFSKQAQLNSKISKLNSQISELEAQNESLQAKILELEALIQEKERIIENLQKLIENLKKQLNPPPF